MGRLFDDFDGLVFHNEAEVSQNFIMPLLVNYLGYDAREVLPEHYYDAKDIYSGVRFSSGGSKSLNHRPDFVVCQDGDKTQPKFIIDSKGPREDIDEHLGQLQSYAISVGKNFLMMTNGKEVKVYDVNNLLFYSVNIADLQNKINYLVELLGRDNQVQKTDVVILKEFNYDEAIKGAGMSKAELEQRRKQIILADFHGYINEVKGAYLNWHLPTNHFRALDNLDARKIDPNLLLEFREYKTTASRFRDNERLKLQQIENGDTVKIKLIIGETGCGKTTLLRYLAHKQAMYCVEYRETVIPVYIPLREIGHNYKLEDLIVSALNRGGYSCNSYFDLPVKNDFIFFFDAFDEIGETFRKEVILAIQNIGTKSFCYVTTRPSVVPNFQASTSYDLLSMSNEQVQLVVRQHLDDRYYEFQRQLEQHNLRAECGNILLLLFLISLFKESGTLPPTVSKIISAIVKRVKIWKDEKSKTTNALKWEPVGVLLASLAYQMFLTGETAMTLEEAEPILSKELNQLEQKRKILVGMSIDMVLELLSQTGLIIINQDHLYFWHRLFLNYFASLGLKKIFEKDQGVITAIFSENRWHVVIVGLASLLQSVTELVKLLDSDLWLSAYCLIENNKCDANVAKQVIDKLIAQTNAVVPEVRQKAARYLALLDIDYARQFFFDVFTGDHYDEIKMIALSFIGKTKSDKAKTILYEHLEWESGSFFTGLSAQASVARGLYYYEEPEHLQIIENWKSSHDYFVDVECKNIFVELHNQNKLTPLLITALEDLFIFQYQVIDGGGAKLEEISRILSLVPNNDFAKKILNLPFEPSDIVKIDGVYNILKEYRSAHVIQLVKAKVFDENEYHYKAEKLADIIVDSVYDVPKEIFYELIAHQNTNIASHAISALKRFPYSEIKETLNAHLFGDQPQLQSWAFGVLVDNGEIVHLIRHGDLPAFYSPAAHTLLKGIRRFHLVEGLFVMDRIWEAMAERKKLGYDISLSMNLAGTYYLMGEFEKQAEVIGWFFDGDKFLQNDENLHFHLMKGLKHIDPKLACTVADCYFRKYFPDGDPVRFKAGVFLETVDNLGQRALVPRVKEMVDYLLTDSTQCQLHAAHELERPMRTLAGLAIPEDEDWILTRLGPMEYDKGLEFPQLRRAVECLAHAGTSKSLPYLKKIAFTYRQSNLLLNTCQFAYEQVCKREKILTGSSNVLTDNREN